MQSLRQRALLLPLLAATASASTSTSTFTTTVTLPSDTYSGSATITATSTSSRTVSLPSHTTTGTPTLTASDPVTLSLPTLSVSVTIPTSTPTQDTVTVPTMTASVTNEITLPSSTDTNTFTTTLPSSTASRDKSVSISESLSFPSASHSKSYSATLPSASTTDSITASLSATLSISETSTASLTRTATDTREETATRSLTPTPTLTLPAHDNYTTQLAPGAFTEGQEVRVALRASLLGVSEFEHFNVSDGFGDLEVTVWEWRVREDFLCEQYAALRGVDPIYRTRQHGMTIEDQLQGNVYVGAAYITFAAPYSGVEWVVCFRHIPTGFGSAHITFPRSGKWLLFTRRGYYYEQRPDTRGDWAFRSGRSQVWYYLPEPTAGQYAVIQINSIDPRWNFTLPSAACSSSDPVSCLDGDNLKLVPEGFPCTYENTYLGKRGDLYYGSRFVEWDGRWHHQAADGLSMGATAGGMGLMGSDTLNPLTDSSEMTAPSVLEPLPLDHSSQLSLRRTYAYARLPRAAGRYEVCFSAMGQRALWARENLTLASVPMWAKLYPCSSDGCSSISPGVLTPAFTVVDETLGWTMLDLSPGTYGTIRIDAGNITHPNGTVTQGRFLDRRPMESWDEAPHARNYWRTRGGDQLRIVHGAWLEDGFTLRPTPLVDRPMGSSPRAGCWYRANDRAWEDGSDMPTQCRDMAGDPTLPPDQRGDDRQGQHDAFCSVYVPRQSSFSAPPTYLTTADSQEWWVCYRRGGVGGWRVLRWHDESHGVPLKWTRLGRWYAPALYWTGPPDWGPESLAGRTTVYATPLVPGVYGSEAMQAESNFTVRWAMNDTRQGTWGPITVAVDADDDYYRGVRISALPWDWGRAYGPGARVADTQGTAVRLVLPTHGCDDPDHSRGSESTDGGQLECNSARAEIDCIGSDYDSAAERAVVYYLRVPDCTEGPGMPAAATTAPGCSATAPCNMCNTPTTTQPLACLCLFRVCWRQGGLNWRVLEPLEVATELLDSSWAASQLSHSRGRRYVDYALATHPWRMRNWTLHEKAPGWLGLYYGLNHPRMLLPAAAAPILGLVAGERRGGVDALFTVFDPASQLSAAARRNCSTEYCDASGDVFRLVRAGDPCDITPRRWRQEREWADTRLSLFCPVDGSGRAEGSGLYGTLPCASAPPAAHLCGGHHCHLNNSNRSTGSLLRLLYDRREAPAYPGVPDVFDDIVAGDSEAFGVPSVAAMVLLPRQGGSFTQCYKQAWSPNWITRWTNWTAEVASTPALAHLDDAEQGAVGVGTVDLPRAEPSRGVLLGGELRRFTISVPASAVAAVFHAKLVVDAEEGCVAWPGGTEATPFGAATARIRAAAGRNNTSEFWLTVPASAGAHWLCVRLRDTLSWLRYGPYEVIDSGARWFVGDWDQPTNQGVSRIGLMRCLPDAVAQRCNTAGALETWNTDPGMDRAKVVRWNDACHSGAEGGVQDHGPSASVSRFDAEAANVSVGTADLGPADGPADVAEFTVGFPRSAGDERQQYKVCAYSFWEAIARRTWVEVPEGTGVDGQIVQLDGPTGRRLYLTTRPSYLKAWHLDTELRARDPLGLHGVVALSGASTLVIRDFAKFRPRTQFALHLSTYSNISDWQGVGLSNHFKLVKVREPISRHPPPPGDGSGWAWRDVADADCLEAGVEGTITTPGSCTDPDTADNATCPQLVGANLTLMHVHIQLPSEPGFYHVCHRKVLESSPSAEPWLWLSGPEGESGIYIVPSFLEFDPGVASADAPEVDLLQLYELRSVDGVSLSSWCAVPNTTAGGPNCSLPVSRHEDLKNDWVAVVNASLVCPVVVPLSSTAFAGQTKYYKVLRTGNVTATPSGGLMLPPNVTSASGTYKVCLIKVSEVATPGAVLRGGIAYQVWNRADTTGASLGQSPYWQPVALGTITHLIATPDTVYNDSLHFIEYMGAATEERYSAVPRSELERLSPLLVSNTPSFRSGRTVDVYVQAGTAAGPAPFGTFQVELHKCPRATSWSSLACNRLIPPSLGRRAEVEQTGEPFTVYNALGACSAENGRIYGWGGQGLRQFLDAGKVHFRLQFRSKCPLGTATISPGCGLRFVAVSDAGRAIVSRPLWFNVEWHYPDSIAVDYGADGSVQRLTAMEPGVAQDVEACRAAGLPRCYVRQCRSHRDCVVDIMALYQGPREFAARGTLSISYSRFDYGSSDDALAVMLAAFSDGPKQLLDKDWTDTGTYQVTFTPKLREGIPSGVMIYNVTYGVDRWTRLLVEVVRPQPSRLVLREIYPLDGGVSGISRTLRRPPAPVWHMQGSPLERPGPLVAQQGSYLEALLPYELRYEVEGELQGVPVLLSGATNELDGWFLEVSIDEVDPAMNSVLEVETRPTDPSAPDARLNIMTAGAYARRYRAKQATNTAESATAWAARLRVRSGFGCGRTTPGNAPDGYGCLIRFTLRRDGRPSISATLQTPVRTEADTLRVHYSVARAPVQDGIVVTVMPGTVETFAGGERWLPDEFHFGEVFALMSSPAPTAQGLQNRDGVMLTDASGAGPGYHRMGVVTHPEQGSVWGAQWVLRTSRPCFKCGVTFHTTWGAGPVAAAGRVDGEVEISMDDRTSGVECSPSTAAPTAVAYSQGKTASGGFSISVTAMDMEQRARTLWPRWWVFTDSARDVALRDGKGSPQGVRLEQLTGGRSSGALISSRMGEGGVAEFHDLRFVRLANATFPEVLDVTFRAMATQYNTTVPGAVPSGRTSFTCAARIALQQDEVVDAPRVLRINTAGSTGATRLCPLGRDDCRQWRLDMSERPTVLKFEVYTVLAGGEVFNNSDANVTVRAGVQADWACQGRTCEAAPVKFVSPYAPVASSTGDRRVYTYGSTTVVFERAAVSAPGGRGSITMRRPPATSRPVRAASFDLCLTVIVGASEVIDSRATCTTITFWAYPTQSAAQLPRRVGITTDTTLGLSVGPLQPGSQHCGGATQFTFQAVVYFEYVGEFYISYAESYELRISSRAEGQVLVSAGDATDSGRVVERITPLQPGLDLIDRISHNLSCVVEFDLYGLNPTSQPEPVQITAADADSAAGVLPVTSSKGFDWAWREERYTGFRVLDAPTSDDYCTPRRRFPQSTHNYISYAPNPGKDWQYYGGTGYTGISVGVPFPITARVLTNASDPESRAWSYPPSLVLARRLRPTGCNYGGFYRVYYPIGGADGETSNSSVVTYSGDLDGFQLSRVFGWALHRGQVTMWSVFYNPCESCILEFRLCFRAATFTLNPMISCLQGDTGEAPIFAVRTQVSRVFSVRNPAADSVRVYNQSQPKEAPGGGVLVGARFTALFEATQSYGPWRLKVAGTGEQEPNLAAFAVFVGEGSALDGAEMRYGNGGFLSTGPESAECDVRPHEFAAASLDRWGATVSGSALQFWFSRPCALCEIHFRYTLGSQQGSFPLRTLGPDAHGLPAPSAFPARFAVRTCGVSWQLAGRTPRTVRRRGPFTVAAWRVDGNGQPAWEGEIPAAVLPADSEEWGGNGGGGALSVTSPLAAQEPPSIPSREGSAVGRAEWSRACYRCGLAVAGQVAEQSVLAEPSQVVAVPRNLSLVAELTGTGPARFAFIAYAADELGDRSYGVGGPTALRDMPLYRQHVLSGVRAAAADAQIEPAPAYNTAGRQLSALYTSSGAGDVATVTDGSMFYDGVPYGAKVPIPGESRTEGGKAGELMVAVGGHQHHFPISFTLQGFPGLPTHSLGTRLPPEVAHSVAATRALSNWDTAATRDISVGDATTVRLWAVGSVPRGNPSVLYTTSLDIEESVVLLTMDCDSEQVPLPRCAACRFALAGREALGGRRAEGWWQTPQWEGEDLYGGELRVASTLRTRFVKGVADVALRVDSGADDRSVAHHCRAVFTTEPALAGAFDASPHVLNLRISHTVLETWRWESAEGGVRVGSDAAAAVHAVDRATVLRAGLYDKRLAPGSRSVRGPTIAPGELTLRTIPDGCFLPSSEPSPSALQNSLEWSGRFTTVGTCVIEGVSGLPTGQGEPPTLRVTAVRAVGIELVPSTLSAAAGEPSNFTRLDGRTAEGDPAAQTGVACGVRVRVVDELGATVEGDYVTAVTLRGSQQCIDGRRPGPDAVPLEARAVARGGVALLEFVPTAATRRPDGVPCPYWFTAQARGPGISAGTSVTVGGLVAAIGPLPVVRVGNVMRVQLRPAMPPPGNGLGGLPEGRWLEADVAAGSCPPGCKGGLQLEGRNTSMLLDSRNYYVAGWPFTLRVAVEDALGQGPLLDEDDGYGATFHWRPLEVPCVDADNADLAEGTYIRGCQEGGECRLAPTRPCGLGDWLIPTAGSAAPAAPTVLGNATNSSNSTTNTSNTAAPSQPARRGSSKGYVMQSEAGVYTIGNVPEGEEPVRYVGLSVPARVVVTATGFAQDPVAAQRVWVVDAMLQRTAAVHLRGPGVECAAINGAAERCTVPSPPWANVDELRDAFDRRRLQGVLRLAPLSEFSVRLAVVDDAGRTVTADSISRLRATAQCHDEDANPGWGLGRLTGFQKDQFLPAELETFVVNGEAYFEDLGFPGECLNASLSATVLPLPPGIDSLELNRKSRVLTSAWFEVRNPQTPVPAPTPEPPPQLPRRWPAGVLSLPGIDLLSFPVSAVQENLRADLNKVLEQRKAAVLAKEVVVELLCNIPIARAGSYPPITGADSDNPSVCKRYAERQDRSPDVLQTPDTVCPCVPMTLFHIVVAGDVSPAVAGAMLDAVAVVAGDPTTALLQLLNITSAGFVSIDAAPTPAPTPLPPGSRTPVPDGLDPPGEDVPAARPPLDLFRSPLSISAAWPRGGDCALAAAASAALLLLAG
eukprot:TRINITY_DN2523_c0_g2_i1.p1 TRINITY_DN2523_c0_g2~~TRINITY_DN2523_c0_g2_i1.p1  ORF type:complete len:4810 (+),score=845.13 TRINITY_DN2523_c0_g2_i1:137-14566(+)